MGLARLERLSEAAVRGVARSCTRLGSKLAVVYPTRRASSREKAEREGEDEERESRERERRVRERVDQIPIRASCRTLKWPN